VSSWLMPTCCLGRYSMFVLRLHVYHMLQLTNNKARWLHVTGVHSTASRFDLDLLHYMWRHLANEIIILIDSFFMIYCQFFQIKNCIKSQIQAFCKSKYLCGEKCITDQPPIHQIRRHTEFELMPFYCTLTLTFNPQTMSLLGYHKVIPYTKFENFGIILFLVMLQTNRQTDRLKIPTHAD